MNEAIEENDDTAIYNGPMQCFCISQKKKGFSSNEVYTLKDEDDKETIFNDDLCS